MTYFSSIDFAGVQTVNYLWPQLVERLGLDKAQKAAHQALDLQRMNHNYKTIPVLLYETCGIGLVNIDLLRRNTGYTCYGEGLILILSTKDALVQLLHKV